MSAEELPADWTQAGLVEAALTTLAVKAANTLGTPVRWVYWLNTAGHGVGDRIRDAVPEGLMSASWVAGDGLWWSLALFVDSESGNRLADRVRRGSSGGGGGGEAGGGPSDSGGDDGVGDLGDSEGMVEDVLGLGASAASAQPLLPVTGKTKSARGAKRTTDMRAVGIQDADKRQRVGPSKGGGRSTLYDVTPGTPSQVVEDIGRLPEGPMVLLLDPVTLGECVMRCGQRR